VPVLNEAESIAFLHSGLEAALAGLYHEVIVVDDGSTDNSITEIAAFHDFRCIAIPHAGKSAALDAGIEAARAPVIVTIDADLQEDPAEIPRLLAALRGGADLACGVRTPRVDGLWRKRIPSRIYRLFLRALFGRDFCDINCGLRAARREVWQAIVWFDGAHRLVPAMVARSGGRLAQIAVRHRPRIYGKAKFDSPLRFLEGIRDAVKVRFGLIHQQKTLAYRETTIG
jgi:dolichol-phosphate mannosyltransferase